MAQHEVTTADLATELGRAALAAGHWTVAAAMLRPGAHDPEVAGDHALALVLARHPDAAARTEALLRTTRGGDRSAARLHAARALLLTLDGPVSDAREAVRSALWLRRAEPMSHLAAAALAARVGDSAERTARLQSYVRLGGPDRPLLAVMRRLPALAGSEAEERSLADEAVARLGADPLACAVAAEARIPRLQRHHGGGVIGWYVARAAALGRRDGSSESAELLVRALRAAPADVGLARDLVRMAPELQVGPGAALTAVAAVGGAAAVAATVPAPASIGLVGALGLVAIAAVLLVVAGLRGRRRHRRATVEWVAEVTRRARSAPLALEGDDGRIVPWTGGCRCDQLVSVDGPAGAGYAHRHLVPSRSFPEVPAVELTCRDSGARWLALSAGLGEAGGAARLVRVEPPGSPGATVDLTAHRGGHEHVEPAHVGQAAAMMPADDRHDPRRDGHRSDDPQPAGR